MSIIFFIFLIAAIDASKIEQKFNPRNDVEFILYTRANPVQKQTLINGDNTVLERSNFVRSHPTKIFIHGRNGPAQNKEFTSAFLAASEANIIMVDWMRGATVSEQNVIQNIPIVGRYIATFVNFLNSNGVRFENVHITGVGEGGHVAGFVGRNCNQRPEYITACDPSKNTWENSNERINSGDAKYVEVIHSNTAFHGITRLSGHTDFYPNGGAVMPGCSNSSCSHFRALDYFINSIDHNFFKANECRNYNEIVQKKCSNLSQLHMGGTRPKYRTGVFYLETNINKPFYKG